MKDATYTRKLLQDIDKLLEKREFYDIYYVLTYIVNSMAFKYNLQEEEIQKQLDMIIKAIEK